VTDLTSIFDRDLDRGPANYVPLTPVSFLVRSALAYPTRTAIVHGDWRCTYQEFYRRCRRFASALVRRGIRPGDTVSIIATNVPALLEAHFAIPMAGAVLNALNYRLDAASLAFILKHGEAKLLLCDREFAGLMTTALKDLDAPPPVIGIDDPVFAGTDAPRLGEVEYESFLLEEDPDFEWVRPRDEWNAIALNYTSGTTGDPKGVVYHHRGAYLNSLGSALNFGLSSRSVLLWTLPMFHCNGWTYTWAATAAGAAHVCLRKVEPAAVYGAIRTHGVTHLCGAPIVMNMLVNAPEEARGKLGHTVEVLTGGAAPPSAIISRLEASGFRVTHAYGLTESYGPSTICVWQEGWEDLPLEERAALMARQGVPCPTLDAQMVADPETMQPVPWDGQTMGELMLRSNTVMKGYLKNPRSTAAAFAGGWFHTGDLAVCHPDGYVEIKDRAKDIIISGGENISSLEVEEALYKHPAVLEAAVVARPDEKWGETPCAFVALRDAGAPATAEDIIAWCRTHMASYKIPRTVVFGPLPKTSTGKIQKFVLRDRARAL